MINNNINNPELINEIRRGEIDINNQEVFFSNLIKGLLLKLDDDIKIRNLSVPHIILHTGDWTMYDYELFFKTKNIPENSQASVEELYSSIPRCIVDVNNVDLLSDQITSPYTHGIMQYEHEDNIYSLIGEFRRMPIKLSCDLRYFFDSYTDVLLMMQQVITKLSFIQTYDITYMGQLIKCSYKVPDSFDSDHLAEVSEYTTDSKYKTLNLSIEVETFLPVWNEKTMIYNDCRISNPTLAIYDKDKFENNGLDLGIRVYETDGINKNGFYEIG